jgi:hypothetical protein
MHYARSFLIALTSVVCFTAGSAARAQAHQSTSGPCTLQSSTVDSGSIAVSIAAKRGFSPAADLAIVDVTVTCKGRPGNGTVAADIEVSRADLVGTREPVEMHVHRMNGYVSYYGTYRHLPGQVVRLAVAAAPGGGSPRITLAYQHRFAAR